MITNLLDTTIKTNAFHVGGEGETTGKIRAIYEKNGFVMTIVADQDGKFHVDVPIEKLVILNDNKWCVVMFWNANQKIRAIKAYRAVTGAGLKDAKDVVEAHMDAVPIKKDLTREAADELARNLSHNESMECEVRRML